MEQADRKLADFGHLAQNFFCNEMDSPMLWPQVNFSLKPCGPDLHPSVGGSHVGIHTRTPSPARYCYESVLRAEHIPTIQTHPTTILSASVCFFARPARENERFVMVSLHRDSTKFAHWPAGCARAPPLTFRPFLDQFLKIHPNRNLNQF